MLTKRASLLSTARLLRILDQEVRDATAELKQSKDGLTTILARQKLAEEKASSIGESIAEYEGYAVKAMEKGDDALALEVAEKIADLENQLDTEKKSAAQFAASANDLRKAILAAEQNIKRIKQQIDTVKATENVQRAQVAVAERHNGSNSKLRTAMDSLDRIKEKQALKSAQIKAAVELAEDSREDSLQDKLEKAGIAASGARAQDVLDRLKNKKS